VRPVVIVVILPLFQLGVEEVNVVGDAVLVQELIELLIVDTVGPLDFAVQMRRPRSDVHVADIQGLEAPVEVRLELGAVVGLDHVDAEREPSQHLVKEADGRPLLHAS